MNDMFKSWPVPKGTMYFPPQAFPEVPGENFTHAAFKTMSERYTRPVIIRGLFKDVPAINWTPEFLANHLGEERLFVAFADNRIGSGSVDASRTITVSVPAVVKNVTNGGNNYLFNSNLQYPMDVDLVKQIGLERLDWKPALLIQFFLGLSRPGESRVGGSPLHCATAPNLNIQLSGEKTWIMIDPKYSGYLRPQLLSDQVAALAGANLEYGATSRWHNFPRFESLVRPGDAIYIPSWWWHEVQNIPGEAWQLSLAIRVSDMFSSIWNNWLFSALVDFGVRHKPCLPGLRLICIEYFGTWEGQTQKKSYAAEEGTRVVEAVVAGKFE